MGKEAINEITAAMKRNEITKPKKVCKNCDLKWDFMFFFFSLPL